MNVILRKSRRRRLLSAVVAGVLATAGLAVAPVQPATATTTATVYTVTQEGLTLAEAQQLSSVFGVPNSLQSNGTFEYFSNDFAQTPSTVISGGVDEASRTTVTEGLDLAAAAAITPIPEADAITRAQRLAELSGLTAGMQAVPVVSHTQLTITDNTGQVRLDQPLDTSVIFQLSLNGLPLTGSGARLRMTFAPDGTVTQLSHSLRRLQRLSDVPVLSATEATQACTAVYQGLAQNQPTLVYQFPELTATNGSGQGTVRQILPQYLCNPLPTGVVLPQLLVPASPGSGPTASFAVSLIMPTQGGAPAQVQAFVSGTWGGTAPYRFRWLSSSTQLPETQAIIPSIFYTRTPRNNELNLAEQVTLQITDANGLTATAVTNLPPNRQGTITGVTAPGGGGLAAFTIPRVDAGTETPVTTGTCGTASNASANGFKSALEAHGVAIQFDWRGNNAWESDFKDPGFGGDDSHYVDDVDIAWYSGHGSPNGFTFNTNHTDAVLAPNEARWGNRDLEWLQLQSCNVLQDITGTHDYFRRWAPSLSGLHMLNGFDTVAGCVTAGLGGPFAERLFAGPSGAALTVRRAWAAAVIARDPGRKYRSMGPLGAPLNVLGITYYPNNINDYFWGQGATGPDITRWGTWSISGWS